MWYLLITINSLVCWFFQFQVKTLVWSFMFSWLVWIYPTKMFKLLCLNAMACVDDKEFIMLLFEKYSFRCVLLVYFYCVHVSVVLRANCCANWCPLIASVFLLRTCISYLACSADWSLIAPFFVPRSGLWWRGWCGQEKNKASNSYCRLCKCLMRCGSVSVSVFTSSFFCGFEFDFSLLGVHYITL